MSKFEEKEFVVLENEGKKIFGIFHRPLVTGKVPAVLMCHGFAGNKIGRYRIYVLLAQHLAKAGIASLRIDFRGCGESEGDFSEITVESEVSDALKGLQFLRTEKQVDPKQIGILGNSFGGAIAVLTAFNDRHIKSLALLAPLFNCAQWLPRWQALMNNHADDHAKKEMARILDGNAPGPAFFTSFFKLNLEKELESLDQVPLLHIHSDRDERVGQDQAECYRRHRAQAKAESKWIRLEKSDHDFSSAEERGKILEATTDWFKQILK